MGRKLIGLTIGFLLTIVLAFYLFPTGYGALIRWLAPYFGPWLRFVFMFIFVLFGDFFSFNHPEPIQSKKAFFKEEEFIVLVYFSH